MSIRVKNTMNPTFFHEHQNAKKKINGNGMYAYLKINKESHFIKKPPSPSSSSSSSSSPTSSLSNGVAAVSTVKAAVSTRPQPRQPVIIYTHSPKIIHTNPRDFMALVQKLTGLSRSDNSEPCQPKKEPGGRSDTPVEGARINKSCGNAAAATHDDDNESLSVISNQNSDSNRVENVQINSCFSDPYFDPLNHCFNDIPLFTPNPSDFFSPAHQPFFSNYADSSSFLLMPNMRSSLSPSSSMEAMKEFHEF